MPKPFVPHRGRGAGIYPGNRFQTFFRAADPEGPNPDDEPLPGTEFLEDSSRSILTFNDSPDIGFEASLNPYRGCEHGCSYCYARPYHEYLGFSSGVDFETKIVVKRNAPALLKEALSSPKWKPRPIALSGVTDCYQPGERRFKITRGCLEVLAEFLNPVGIVTKNFLVTRDADVLQELARREAAAVFISVTTLDENLSRVLEPRASRPSQRLAAVEILAKAGIPVGVMMAPVIPAVNEHEIPAVLKAARDRGASTAAYTVLRLPYAVKDIFSDWLGRHFPDRKEKVLHRIQSLRGGKLNSAEFGARMRGEGIFADQIRQLFRLSRRKCGYPEKGPKLSTDSFRRPSPQLSFDF